ncbi:MAG TPA: GNAT family N-acetyltransferase [Terracidiphilus sp.]|jgi:predicted acetyltransferase
MTKAKDTAPARPELVPATPEQEPVLANMLELYAHDFSEFHAIELGPDGRFGYPNLPLYWRERGRYPFLVKMEGKLAGFVLVKRGSQMSESDAIWDMAEFFVIRGYRRRGIGTMIAHEVWRRFPGLWEVRVMQSNHAARAFWELAIARFGVNPRHFVQGAESGELWDVFSFQSRLVERRK